MAEIKDLVKEVKARTDSIESLVKDLKSINGQIAASSFQLHKKISHEACFFFDYQERISQSPIMQEPLEPTYEELKIKVLTLETKNRDLQIELDSSRYLNRTLEARIYEYSIELDILRTSMWNKIKEVFGL